MAVKATQAGLVVLSLMAQPPLTVPAVTQGSVNNAMFPETGLSASMLPGNREVYANIFSGIDPDSTTALSCAGCYTDHVNVLIPSTGSSALLFNATSFCVLHQCVLATEETTLMSLVGSSPVVQRPSAVPIAA